MLKSPDISNPPLLEISELWNNLDRCFKNDAISLYNTQFVVICRSANLLVGLEETTNAEA